MLLPALPKSTRCQELMLQLHGCYQNPSSQHRSLAQRNQNIFPRLSARWTFHLAMPKSRNWKFAICRTPLTGSFPASGYAAFPHAAFSDPELLTPCHGPALPGLPDHSFPVTDVKRKRCRRECARSKIIAPPGSVPLLATINNSRCPGRIAGLVDLRLRPLSRSGSTICPIGSPLRLKTMTRPRLRWPHIHCLRCRHGPRLAPAR